MKDEKVELPLLKGTDREKCIPISIIVGGVVLLIIGLILCLSLTFKGTYTLHYKDESSIDYKVWLKENDFYESKYLTKDKQYISSLIDNIDANFNYKFTSEADIGLEYTYYVIASVQIDNSDGKNIFSKDEYVVEKKKFTELSNKQFILNENVKVDYDKYNQLATAFLNEYGLNADANLVVSLYVDVVGKHAEFDKKISDNAVITLKVPLTNKTVDIKMDYDLSNNVDEILQYKSTVIKSPALFTLAIILAVLDVCAIAAIIIWIIDNRDSQTIYNKKLDRILKDYGRYISETVITERVEDMMNTRSLRIEVVKSFEGLIDIRDNVNKPILYHEERPGEEAIFYIITDRVGYLYVMRASEMKKRKKKKTTEEMTEK